MKLASLILGLLGGLFGIVAAFLSLFAGGVTGAENSAIAMAYLSIPISLVGLIGGAMAFAKPKAAGIMMLIAGVGGFVTITVAYLLAGPLLIVGAIMALVVGKTLGKKTEIPL